MGVRRWRSTLFGVVALGSLGAGAWSLYAAGKMHWQREHPLTWPLAVVNVAHGVLTLEDGRTLRAAGVARAAWVSTDEYDAFLRIACRQGVEVVREIDGGRAMLRVEPRFHETCGTCAAKTKIAGRYLAVPLSELLVESCYAEPDWGQAGLSEEERASLAVAAYLRVSGEEPRGVNEALGSMGRGQLEFYLEDWPAYLSIFDIPAPPPVGTLAPSVGAEAPSG